MEEVRRRRNGSAFDLKEVTPRTRSLRVGHQDRTRSAVWVRVVQRTTLLVGDGGVEGGGGDTEHTKLARFDFAILFELFLYSTCWTLVPSPTRS